LQLCFKVQLLQLIGIENLPFFFFFLGAQTVISTIALKNRNNVQPHKRGHRASPENKNHDPLPHPNNRVGIQPSDMHVHSGADVLKVHPLKVETLEKLRRRAWSFSNSVPALEPGNTPILNKPLPDKLIDMLNGPLMRVKNLVVPCHPSIPQGKAPNEQPDLSHRRVLEWSSFPEQSDSPVRNKINLRDPGGEKEPKQRDRKTPHRP
jgi:hypothetical protein